MRAISFAWLLTACATSARPAPTEPSPVVSTPAPPPSEPATAPPIELTPSEPSAPAPSVERVVAVDAGGVVLETTLVGRGARPMLLLHGYGADGADMVPLARLLAARADLTVAVPAAPRTWRHGAPGRAWFERTDADANEQIERAAIEVEAVLAALASERPGAPILAGFSQGAQLAIELALRRAEPAAGLVVLSGRALPRFRGRWGAVSGAPVLVTHGRADPLIPFRDGERMARDAEAAGARVTFVPFEGGHALPVEVETALFDFLERLAS